MIRAISHIVTFLLLLAFLHCEDSNGPAKGVFEDKERDSLTTISPFELENDNTPQQNTGRQNNVACLALEEFSVTSVMFPREKEEAETTTEARRKTQDHKLVIHNRGIILKNPWTERTRLCGKSSKNFNAVIYFAPCNVMDKNSDICDDDWSGEQVWAATQPPQNGMLAGTTLSPTISLNSLTHYSLPSNRYYKSRAKILAAGTNTPLKDADQVIDFCEDSTPPQNACNPSPCQSPTHRAPINCIYNALEDGRPKATQILFGQGLRNNLEKNGQTPVWIMAQSGTSNGDNNPLPPSVYLIKHPGDGSQAYRENLNTIDQRTFEWAIRSNAIWLGMGRAQNGPSVRIRKYFPPGEYYLRIQKNTRSTDDRIALFIAIGNDDVPNYEHGTPYADEADIIRDQAWDSWLPIESKEKIWTLPIEKDSPYTILDARESVQWKESTSDLLQVPAENDNKPEISTKKNILLIHNMSDHSYVWVRIRIPSL